MMKEFDDNIPARAFDNFQVSVLNTFLFMLASDICISLVQIA